MLSFLDFLILSYFRFVSTYHGDPLNKSQGWWKRAVVIPKEEEVIDNVFRLRKRNSKSETDLLSTDDFDTVFRLKKRKN